MTKVVKLSLAEMKALLPPVPVLANESLQQLESIFDQVVMRLNITDMVELTLIRTFVIASWEEARYLRERAVGFDRKFKDVLELQVQHLQSHKARREALAKALAEHLTQRPADVQHLVHLEEKVTEVHDEIAEILKRTPTELAYNKALERNIGFHKDLEFLITSITKRRNEALEVLDRYRQGLGKRAEQVVQEILDAEYKEVETAAVEHRGVENPPAKAGAADNQTRQLPPPLLPPAEADAKKAVTVSASVDEDDDDGSDE
jgi:hypothetical protein